MSPARVSSVRRIYRASKPPAHVEAAHGLLAGKTTGVRPPLKGRAKVTGERVSSSPDFDVCSLPAPSQLYRLQAIALEPDNLLQGSKYIAAIFLSSD